MLGIRGGNNLRYGVAGIINFDLIPNDKKHLPIGTDENPVPLVQFLPDLKNQKFEEEKTDIEVFYLGSDVS